MESSAVLRRARSSEHLYPSSSSSEMRPSSSSAYRPFCSDIHTFAASLPPHTNFEPWRHDLQPTYNGSGSESGDGRPPWGWLFVAKKPDRATDLRRTKSTMQQPVSAPPEVLVDLSTLCPPPVMPTPRPAQDRTVPPPSSTLVWVADEERWMRRVEHPHPHPHPTTEDSIPQAELPDILELPRHDRSALPSPTISLSMLEEDGDADAPPSYVQSQLEEARRRAHLRRTLSAGAGSRSYQL
ncbi:MAG: hypothetical protein M1815_004919 [Lichina confinis]|nr:MAG: hypothetical protein M1815_004919 [Lichina confinis]